MTFEEYLISKKIDGEAFCKSEPALWAVWKKEFEQMHPKSFTSQKLYLINPLRRKYPGKVEVVVKADQVQPEQKSEAPTVNPKPAIAKPGKPVFRPKPKMG